VTGSVEPAGLYLSTQSPVRGRYQDSARLGRDGSIEELVGGAPPTRIRVGCPAHLCPVSQVPVRPDVEDLADVAELRGPEAQRL
jgi:hypothetical protein